MVAYPVAALDLTALIKNSELIVVGRVVALRDGGELTVSVNGQSVRAHRTFGTLKVTRMLKGGGGRARIDIEFFRDEWGMITPILIDEFGMFFLRHTGMNTYGPSDRNFPLLVALLNPPVSKVDPFDRVVSELVNVITSTSDVASRIQAIDALNNVRNVQARSALKRAARDAQLSVRLSAVASLVRQNDKASVDTAIEILLGSSQRYDQTLFNKLKVAIRAVNDPALATDLSRLLEAPDTTTRRAATYALRQMRTSAASKSLSKALNDSDREVRYQAVIGLAEITSDYQWGPALEIYLKDENLYLKHWKDWSKNR